LSLAQHLENNKLFAIRVADRVATFAILAAFAAIWPAAHPTTPLEISIRACHIVKHKQKAAKTAMFTIPVNIATANRASPRLARRKLVGENLTSLS